MLRRLFIMKMLIVLHVAFVSFGLSAGSTFVGSKAVNWTFYTKLKLSWDEAAQFCRERSSHLPVTNTSITTAAFHDAAKSMGVDDFWLGLHSLVPGKTANVWEADCSLLPTNFQYWGTNEPDDKHADLCIRMRKGEWKTNKCTGTYHFACEKERGNCTYSTLSDVTMIAAPNASTGSVITLAACWSLCLEVYLQGQECVVAALLQTTAVCNLYLGERLLGKSDVKTSPMEESTVMVRQCFQTLEDESGLKPEINTSTLSRCPSIYTASAKTEDNLPPGVALGPTVVTTQPPSNDSGDSMTTTASSSPDPSTTATTTTSSSQPATTVETTMAPSSESTTSEAKTSTAASTEKTVGCKAVKIGAGRCRCVFEKDKNIAHQQTNGDLGTSTTPSPQVAVVPTNTSKFRRSKTSAVITGASYTVLGTTWIFVIASVFCLIILSDLTRFCQWVAKHKAKVKARRGVEGAP